MGKQKAIQVSYASETVVKANALIEAGHRLSLAEQRVVLAAIAQVRRDESLDSRTWYSVTAGGLADVAGIDASDAYESLVSAAKRLYERNITITERPNGEQGAPGQDDDVLQCRWVQAIRYRKREGRVVLMFAEPVTPYLAQLKTHFTKYQLEHVAPMRSRFGPRLYELLAQWRQFGEREVSIDWLQDVWGTDHKRVYDLKRWAIKPAIDDVNKHSDLAVEVGYRKTGRRVTHVQFKFEPKSREPSRKPLRPSSSHLERRRDGRITRAEIERRARPGESYEEAERRIDAEDQQSTVRT